MPSRPQVNGIIELDWIVCRFGKVCATNKRSTKIRSRLWACFSTVIREVRSHDRQPSRALFSKKLIPWTDKYPRRLPTLQNWTEAGIFWHETVRGARNTESGSTKTPRPKEKHVDKTTETVVSSAWTEPKRWNAKYGERDDRFRKRRKLNGLPREKRFSRIFVTVISCSGFRTLDLVLKDPRTWRFESCIVETAFVPAHGKYHSLEKYTLKHRCAIQRTRAAQ